MYFRIEVRPDIWRSLCHKPQATRYEHASRSVRPISRKGTWFQMQKRSRSCRHRKKGWIGDGSWFENSRTFMRFWLTKDCEWWPVWTAGHQQTVCMINETIFKIRHDSCGWHCSAEFDRNSLLMAIGRFEWFIRSKQMPFYPTGLRWLLNCAYFRPIIVFCSGKKVKVSLIKERGEKANERKRRRRWRCTWKERKRRRTSLAWTKEHNPIRTQSLSFFNVEQQKKTIVRVTVALSQKSTHFRFDSMRKEHFHWQIRAETASKICPLCTYVHGLVRMKLKLFLFSICSKV